MLKLKLNIALILLFLSPGLVNGIINTGNEKPVLISEKIFLNTDRRIYIAGENLLFSMYLIDTKVNSLADYPSIGYVILRNTKGEVIGKSQVKITEGKASGAIYLSDTLHSGCYQVMAYTNFMRNGSPDIYFKTQVIIANRFDKDFFDLVTQQNADSSQASFIEGGNKYVNPLNVTLNKTYYNKREKAGFKINILESGIKFSDLTISIVEKNLVEERLSKNLSRSVRVSKAAYFDASGSTEKPLYLAENKHAELLGRLTDDRGDAIGYHVLSLSSPDTVTNFEYAVTDARGYFRFPLPDYYSGKDLFIKVKQNEGESLIPKIVLDSKFKSEDSFSPAAWPIDSSVITYLKNSQNIIRIQKSFSLIQFQHQPLKLQSGIPLLFRVPDFSVAPADYAELKDFIEISREIIPTLKIRKHDQDYIAEILDLQQRKYLSYSPMIFLDGVLIDNISQVITFGTRDIKKIDVISSPWIVDHQELSGILSIYTHNNLWKNITLSNNNLRIKAESYYELPGSFHPNYSIIDSQSREPDFRQLLYWNPGYHLTSGNSGMVEFYTSDHTASYIIKVSGISDKGEVIEAYSEFEVKDNF